MKHRAKRHTGLELLRSCRPDPRALLGVALWTALEALPNAVSGIAVARAVDTFRTHHAAQAVAWLLALAAAIVAGAVATRRLYAALAPAVETMRDRLTSSVVRGSVADLAHTGRTGSAPLTQVLDQIDQVRNLVSAVARSLRTTVAPIVGAAIGLTALDPVLALVVLAPVLLAVIAYAGLLRAMVRAEHDAASADEQLGEIATAALGDPAVLRGLRADAWAAAEIGRAARRTGRADVAVARLHARRHLILALGGYVPLLTVVLVAGPMLREGRISIGDVMGAATYVLTALIPALSASMSGTGGWIVQLNVLLDRLAAVADNHEPIRVRPPRSAGPSALTARGLTFRYRPDSRAILSDVDLDVAAGELVALVGPSGAGKSTFANLCAGMLAPTSGFVGAGRRLVLLPQHPYIVAGTYRENLSYLAPAQLADDPAWSAVDAVELTDLIIHAGGLDADVADLGRGDAQRLVLARAWLSGAEVLVIDEGWSLLDADARHRIENRFRMAGRTLVVVSHHLDIAPRADRVLYFDGNDVTTGRHDELLQRSASYRELVAFAAGA